MPSGTGSALNAGESVRSVDQAQALARAGHKVGILAPKVWGVRDYRAGPLPDMNLIAAEDEGFVRVWRLNTLHRLPRMPYRDSRAFCAAGRRLYDAYAAAEGQPDVLHGHAALYGGVLAADLSRRTGVPAVLTEHSTDYAQGKHRWWQKLLIRRALRDARARLAVSPQLHDILIDQYAGAARPLEVVPNILTPAFEANPPPTDEMPGPFIFLCVARISAEKNQDGLIRAFAQAFPEGDEELHFIGSGEAAVDHSSFVTGSSPSLRVSSRYCRETTGERRAASHKVVPFFTTLMDSTSSHGQRQHTPSSSALSLKKNRTPSLSKTAFRGAALDTSTLRASPPTEKAVSTPLEACCVGARVAPLV